MKKTKFFILLIISILIGGALSFAFYSFYIVKDVRNFEMDVIIKDNIF